MYMWTKIKEKEPCFSKKGYMEVNEHIDKRVSNFTLGFTTTFAISANHH